MERVEINIELIQAMQDKSQAGRGIPKPERVYTTSESLKGIETMTDMNPQVQLASLYFGYLKYSKV